MKKCSMKQRAAVGVMGAGIVFLTAGWVQAGVIAYWRFEPGTAFTLDSSGNGNGLTNNRAIQSPDTPPHVGGSGSAYFDGGSGSNAFMQTTGT